MYENSINYAGKDVEFHVDCYNIADSVAFERVVSQQIDLGPFAPLPDGDYLLRAMVYLCPQGKP